MIIDFERPVNHDGYVQTKREWGRRKAQENLCESRGGRAGLPVPIKPDGFCGRTATLEEEEEEEEASKNTLYTIPGTVRHIFKRI